ncbi:glycosyltransferase family 2 protein [Rhodanobacter ginsengisoli]|uniref:Glycosyltransferase family 2 protein n=1 Tax=Rhodanobacter ginsengisoli TaxID=418646 RepID=A0ABW0QSQ4_9GAMM
MNEAITPLISTIIPTYRRPALLQRAIASAIEQQGVDVCVSVFDNCSGDDTADVVNRLARSHGRIKYHCHPSNLGAGANFDFAMRSVDTPFFSILSDDDYLLPGFYEHAIASLAEHPEAMFWAGTTLSVDEHGVIWDARVDRWPREGLFNPPQGLMAMMHGMAPVWTGIVFRREVLERVGFIDQATLGPSDLDFMLRVAASHPFVLSKHPSAVYMLNNDSFSATQPLSAFWPGWQKMFLNIEANESLDEESRNAALAALHHDAQRMLFRRGANALAAGRYDFAREAAQALQGYYGRKRWPWTLRFLASLCESVPRLQRLYAGAYRAWERHLVASRADLEARYGHLVQRPS